MNKNYTPGPWHVGGNGTIIYDAEGWGVANATVFHGRHPGAAEANAHLIAAAPELLAALQEVVMLAQEMHTHWDNDRDIKVGKYLLALSGQLPGYDKRTNELHAVIIKATRGAT